MPARKKLLVSLFVVLAIFLFLPEVVSAAIQFNIDNAVPLDTEINLTASISGLITSSCSSEGKCYFQGTLRRVGSSYYFGQTQNNAESWIDYISSPELEYIQSTFYSFQPNSGSWSGQLKMRFSVDDAEYKGPGDYELKVRRFSGNSKNPSSESNLLSLALTAALPTPIPTSTPVPTSTPTPTPTNSPASTPTPTPTPKPTPFASPASSFSASSSSKVMATGLSLVLGESVSSTAGAVISPKPKTQAIKSSKAPNFLTPVLLILGALAVLGTGVSLFWLKRKKMYNE